MDQPQPERGIRYTDRVFVDGINGSGKSELVNHLATGFNCQILLYDTKDEFTVPGVEPVHSPEKIDWDQRIIHVIDDRGDLAETNRLFKVCWERKTGRNPMPYGLILVVHEAGDLCADQPGGTPQFVSVYVRKGRAHGLGLICASQRPRNMPRVIRTESQHIMSFATGLDPEDMPVVAKMHGMSVPEFEHALEQAAQLGEHAYVWYDKRVRENVICPPLPEQMRQQTIATGIDPSRHHERHDEDQEPELEQESDEEEVASTSG